jgi:predicted nucleotidyltransferase
MKVRNFLDCIIDEKIWQILRQYRILKGECSARHMAKITGMHHRTCGNYMNHLAACAILDMRPVGRANMYSLKDSYFVNKLLLPLLQKEHQIYADLKTEILRNFSNDSKAIIVFGSYSRYEETDESDLDICLVVNKKSKLLEDKIYDYCSKVWDKFELKISTYILTISELKQKKDLDLIKDIYQEGDWIYGDKAKIDKD